MGKKKLKLDLSEVKDEPGTKIWSRSMTEELLAVLYLIAGLLAWTAGIKILAWLLFGKAIVDTLCSTASAFQKNKKGGEGKIKLIVKARIEGDMRLSVKKVFEGTPLPKVFVTVEGEEEQCLYDYFPDEIAFTADEFIGLSLEEAKLLKYTKDVAFLQL